MPNRSKGRGQRKSDPTGPPGWGLGRGLMTLSRKKKNYYRNQKQNEFTINDARELKPAGHLRTVQATDTP